MSATSTARRAASAVPATIGVAVSNGSLIEIGGGGKLESGEDEEGGGQ